MKVSKLDYVNDPFTVIDEAHKLTLAFAKMNRAFLQFEQLLGEPFDDPITHITHLYEYVTVGINSINDYTRSSSQDYISQFKQIQKLYILGQGFVDLRKLPFYSLVNKESYHPDEYAKYLVKAGDMTELFEHCISFLKGGIGSATTPNPQNFLGENVPSARYNNEQMRSFAMRYLKGPDTQSETTQKSRTASCRVPRQFIPLFCASIFTVSKNKKGGYKDHGPVYNVANDFIRQSKEIISNTSFHELLKEINLDDPELAELYSCWNILNFYEFYRIGSVLFREEFGITDLIPTEGYASNFIYHLNNYLRQELPACGGHITVLLERLREPLSWSYGKPFFDLLLLFMSDYLNFILGTGMPGPADENLRLKRFDCSIAVFSAAVLTGTWDYYYALDLYALPSAPTVPAVPSPVKLLSEIKDARQTILQSPFYDPELFFLFQMFDSCKTGELKMTDDKK